MKSLVRKALCFIVNFILASSRNKRRSFLFLWGFTIKADVLLNGLISKRSILSHPREHYLYVLLIGFVSCEKINDTVSIFWTNETDKILRNSLENSIFCSIHSGFISIFKWTSSNNFKVAIISDSGDSIVNRFVSLGGSKRDITVISRYSNCLIHLLKESKEGKVCIVAIDKQPSIGKKYSQLTDSVLLMSKRINKKIILTNTHIHRDGSLELRAAHLDLTNNNFHSTVIEWARKETGSEDWEFC